MIKLITAVSVNNVIGVDDKLPWHIKEEFVHFKNTTKGHSLLFGRTTFLGLPKKLPNRTNIVLSPTNVETADVTINNEEQLLDLFTKYKNSNEILFISGGKSIYERYINYADELIISRIKKEYSGNVYLNLDLSKFKLNNIIQYEEFDVEYWIKVS